MRLVVLVPPTSVAWQALRDGGQPPKVSSLRRGSEDLPYVPLRGDELLGQMLRQAIVNRISHRPHSSAMVLHAAHEGGLANHDAVEAATIPVERVRAPLLVFAGEKDEMWPSVPMAEALMARRREYQAGVDDRLVTFPEGGHFLRPPVTPTTVAQNESLVSGGTPEGNAAGARQAWAVLLETLASRLR
jgi:pimeloyl-ACP methyl ester carboxylesterase